MLKLYGYICILFQFGKPVLTSIEYKKIFTNPRSRSHRPSFINRRSPPTMFAGMDEIEQNHIKALSYDLELVHKKLKQRPMLSFSGDDLISFLNKAEEIVEMSLEENGCQPTSRIVKLRAFVIMEKCFQILKPSVIVENVNYDATGGTSVPKSVQSFLSKFDSVNFQLPDILQNIECVNGSGSMHKCCQYQIMCSIHNIFRHLKELEHLLQRAKNILQQLPTGPFNDDFYVDCEIDYKKHLCVLHKKTYLGHQSLNMFGNERRLKDCVSYLLSRASEDDKIPSNSLLEEDNSDVLRYIVRLIERSVAQKTGDLNMEESAYLEGRRHYIITLVGAFVFSVSVFSKIPTTEESKDIFEKIVVAMKGCEYLINSIPFFNLLNPAFFFAIYEGLVDIIYACKQMEKQDCPSHVLKSVDELSQPVTQVFKILVKQSHSPKAALATQTEAEIPIEIRRDGFGVCEDAVVDDMEWSKKFSHAQDLKDILAACPSDVCAVCHITLESKIADHETLIILPKCPHVFCLNCIEGCFRSG